MEWDKYRFFKLSGSLRAIAEKRLDAIAEKNNKLKEFLDGFNTDMYMKVGRRVVAIFNSGAIPDGWKVYSKDKSYIVPDKKKAIGKKAALQLQGFDTPDDYELFKAIGCMGVTESSNEGLVLRLPKHFTIKKFNYIAVPKKETGYEVTDEMKEIPSWKMMKMYSEKGEMNEKGN